MRRNRWTIVLLTFLVMVMSTTPALADSECKRCESSSWGTTVAVVCAQVPRDQIGNLKCKVYCYSDPDEIGICECYEEGDFCMVIVVEG